MFYACIHLVIFVCMCDCEYEHSFPNCLIVKHPLSFITRKTSFKHLLKHHMESHLGPLNLDQQESNPKQMTPVVYTRRPPSSQVEDMEVKDRSVERTLVGILPNQPNLLCTTCLINNNKTKKSKLLTSGKLGE